MVSLQPEITAPFGRDAVPSASGLNLETMRTFPFRDIQ